MDPESKKLLEESLKLGEENNKLLRSLHRSMRIRRFMSIIYWVLIIGSAFGAYYFAEPYIGQVKEAYGGAKSNFEEYNQFFQNLKDKLPR